MTNVMIYNFSLDLSASTSASTSIREQIAPIVIPLKYAVMCGYGLVGVGASVLGHNDDNDERFEYLRTETRYRERTKIVFMSK